MGARRLRNRATAPTFAGRNLSDVDDLGVTGGVEVADDRLGEVAARLVEASRRGVQVAGRRLGINPRPARRGDQYFGPGDDPPAEAAAPQLGPDGDPVEVVARSGAEDVAVAGIADDLPLLLGQEETVAGVLAPLEGVLGQLDGDVHLVRVEETGSGDHLADRLDVG